MSTTSVAEQDWLLSFPPQRSLPLDQEALSILERAYHLGLQTEEPSKPPITFSTLLLALFWGLDETSVWFARTSLVSGPRRSSVLQEKSRITDLSLTVPFTPGRPSGLRVSDDNQILTASARSVLQTAEKWALDVGGSDIGVRHLVAAYVLNPPAAHRKQMNDWGFQERAWRSHFFDWVGQRYTAESWSDVQSKVAPALVVSAFEQVKVKGAALDFPGDVQAMQVLERAARLHAGQPDAWLRLHTVLFALVEEIRVDDGLREAIKPIRDAWLGIQPRYEQSLGEYRKNASSVREVVPFDRLDISPRVLNALETARGLARAGSEEQSEISALHLAAAFVSRRVDSDDDWVSMGFDPQAIRLKMIEHALAQGATVEIWREALGEEEGVTVGRVIELNSDEPEAVVRSDEKWTADPLRIRPDVASFAALLSAKSLSPPLAIGIFGPWGSGKTTFLKRLRRAIDERTSASVTPAVEATFAETPPVETPTSPFVKNVVHVEFDAWHFSEEALVSSLLETILRRLKSFLRQDDPAIGDSFGKLKWEAVANARREVEEARQKESEARHKVELAQAALVASRAEASKGQAGVQAAVREAWKSVRATLVDSKNAQAAGVLKQLDESVASLAELKDRLSEVRNRPGRLLSDLGWPMTVVFALAVFVFPVLLAWGLNSLLSLGGVEKFWTALGAVISMIMLWLRIASSAVSKVDQALTEVVRVYEKQISEDETVKQATNKLAAHQGEVAKASELLAAAERELSTAAAAAAAVSLPAQMVSLLSQRLEERTYSKELTTISAAREDLQKLSLLFREQMSAAASTTGERAVDRVILYIDDLDRCKPQDVVRVLQVVHMLLAFELFVVVVAVDARWVEESLKQNYHWLHDGEPDEGVSASRTKGSSRVTPQDYLEKIFQISFWLEPMTASRAAEYLKTLVRTPRRNLGAPNASAPGADGVNEIRILPIELDYMRALAEHIGPSPRRVKRLVNAYRLLKARLSDGQLKGFVTDRNMGDEQLRSGPYQLAIGLLVIGTGAPLSGASILAELANRDPADTFSTVIDAFRRRNQPDWTMAAKVIETLARTQKAKNISELRGWARRVSRFLLHGPADVPCPAPSQREETYEENRS